MEERGTTVILIDALGHEIVKRHGFLPSGLSKPRNMPTVLGFSQAALTTILTGLSPAEHGLWMMYSFAAGSSPFRWIGMLPVSSRRRLLRNSIRWVLDHIYHVDSYYSLYDVPREILIHLDLPARSRMFGPGGAGKHMNIFDELEARRTNWISWDHTVPEERAFDELERAVESGDHGFRFLYTAGLDSTMHRYGTKGEQTRCHLGWYRDRIERIVSRCGGGRVVVLGDHGMCDVKRHLDLKGRVDELGLNVPHDFIPFYDSTMARFKIRREAAGRRLEGLLFELEGGSLLDADAARRLGVHTADGRFGDLVFLVEPGTIILPSYMSSEPVAAMHGYRPEASCMEAAIFSNQERVEWPAAPTDIARFLLPGFEAGERT